MNAFPGCKSPSHTEQNSRDRGRGRTNTRSCPLGQRRPLGHCDLSHQKCPRHSHLVKLLLRRSRGCGSWASKARSRGSHWPRRPGQPIAGDLATDICQRGMYVTSLPEQATHYTLRERDKCHWLTNPQLVKQPLPPCWGCEMVNQAALPGEKGKPWVFPEEP